MLLITCSGRKEESNAFGQLRLPPTVSPLGFTVAVCSPHDRSLAPSLYAPVSNRASANKRDKTICPSVVQRRKENIQRQHQNRKCTDISPTHHQEVRHHVRGDTRKATGQRQKTSRSVVDRRTSVTLPEATLLTRRRGAHQNEKSYRYDTSLSQNKKRTCTVHTYPLLHVCKKRIRTVFETSHANNNDQP